MGFEPRQFTSCMDYVSERGFVTGKCFINGIINKKFQMSGNSRLPEGELLKLRHRANSVARLGLERALPTASPVFLLGGMPCHMVL